HRPGNHHLHILRKNLPLRRHDLQTYRTQTTSSPLGPGQFFRPLHGLVDGANHVEGVFRKVVVFPFQNLLEAADRFLDGYIAARLAGESFGDMEGLRQEAFNPARPVYDQLVFVGELIHPEDGDDVLQLLIALQNLLYAPGRLVVLLSHNRRTQDAGGGGQGVHRRIDPLVGNPPLQVGRGIQVGEGGRRRRVGIVVRRDVDRLDRGDRTLLRGGDPLLQLTHLRGEGRLVTHGGGHPSQQRGHLGSRLGEAEDVVDEEKDVLTVLIPEVFGHGQTGQSDAEAGPRRFVHLTEDHRRLGDHSGILHFVVQVVSFTGPFTYAGEDGDPSVLLGDVVNQLLDQNGFTDPRTAEQSDLDRKSTRLNSSHV